MPISIRGISLRHVGNFTVANLPTTTTLRTLTAGDNAYATNGRKNAEGAGAGTGTMVYWDGTAWRRTADDTTVAA